MILYSVNCKGSVTNNEWSIVTIHKSHEGAEETIAKCKDNLSKYNPNSDSQYCIFEIDTDDPWDCIYDYDTLDDIIDDDFDEEEA